MKIALTFLAIALLSCGPSVSKNVGDQRPLPTVDAEDPINYDDVFPLDAEELAEYGMKEAYDSLQPKLKSLGIKLGQMTQTIDDTGRYSVTVEGKAYKIWNWGNNPKAEDARPFATAVFFETINDQLTGSPYKFYALYDDNDLGGVFLTNTEFQAAVAFHVDRANRPYLPNRNPPQFGFPQ